MLGGSILFNRRGFDKWLIFLLGTSPSAITFCVSKKPPPDKYTLSDDQLADFQRDGFLGKVSLLNPEQIAQLRDELMGFFSPEHKGRELWYEYHSNESSDPGAVLFHALGAWRLRPGMHDFLWNPAMLVPASQLLEGSVRFWHDQLFCKPAGDGGVVAWH